MEDCLLNDPNLGIISEVDHRVGHCLCHKCTCGQHLCTYRSLFSRGSLRYRSSYSAFKPHVLSRNSSKDNLPKKSPSPHLHQRFTSESTYKQDYLSQVNSLRTNAADLNLDINIQLKQPKLHFVTGRTLYHDEFMEKVSEPVQSFAPCYASVAGKDGKSSDFLTTYASNFGKIKKSVGVRYKSVDRLKIFSDIKIYSESTSKRDFQGAQGFKPKILQMPARIIEVFGKSVIKPISTHQREFKAQKSLVKNPQRRFTRNIVRSNSPIKK